MPRLHPALYQSHGVSPSHPDQGREHHAQLYGPGGDLGGGPGSLLVPKTSNRALFLGGNPCLDVLHWTSIRQCLLAQNKPVLVDLIQDLTAGLFSPFV